MYKFWSRVATEQFNGCYLMQFNTKSISKKWHLAFCPLELAMISQQVLDGKIIFSNPTFSIYRIWQRNLWNAKLLITMCGNAKWNAQVLVPFFKLKMEFKND
jgi:hypothetical protein